MLSHQLSKISKISKIFFPYTCILCGDSTNRNIDLCEACERDLPFLGENYALFSYQEVIKKLILGIKFGNNLVYTKVLGILLSNYLCAQYNNQNKPEVIIPVPLHTKRLGERGYNQALELIRYTSRNLQIPIDKTSITRVINTPPQACLALSERILNIKDAFNIHKPMQYQHVALFDDVITTGNTINELSTLLYKNGVSKIDIWCCARA